MFIAIEFVAEIEDGVIKIPERYLERLPKEFRVIILMDELTCPKSKKKSINSKRAK